MKDYLDRNREVIFLNKKELKKLNRKERQDYLETQKRYIRFQEPLMTGMIKHIENAHEFNSGQHLLDENYLIETYEEITNKESFAKRLSEIKKEAKKIKKKEKKTSKIPVVEEEEIVEKNNGMKNDTDIVRWSHIGYFLKYTIIVYLLVNIVCLIFKGGEFLTTDMQFWILVCSAFVGYVGYGGKYYK